MKKKRRIPKLTPITQILVLQGVRKLLPPAVRVYKHKKEKRGDWKKEEM